MIAEQIVEVDAVEAQAEDCVEVVAPTSPAWHLRLFRVDTAEGATIRFYPLSGERGVRYPASIDWPGKPRRHGWVAFSLRARNCHRIIFDDKPFKILGMFPEIRTY
ncbi:MAG TPA: hypothetical protein VEA99_18330 [Gemmatimonadaceae bacterium]|nr:hypothetical protein [Gemmatimonadaceae bacterium]